MKSHKNSLVKVLEYLVNEEREKASELLHTIFVEKAKNHWSALSESDEYTEDDIQDDDDLDEAYTFEEIDDSDDEEDFVNDIESADDEIDNEEFYDNDENDEDGMDAASDELAFDMDVDDEDEAMDDEDNTSGGDVSDALTNVKDAIEELRAAFADIEGIGDNDHEEPDGDEDGSFSDYDDDNEEPDFSDYEDDETEDEMDNYEDEDEDEVEPFKESAELRKVNVKSKNGEDSGAKSPVKDAGNDMATPHDIDTSEEKSKKASAPKKMNVRGPQGAAKLSAAPAPKRPDTKATSPSPLRGRK